MPATGVCRDEIDIELIVECRVDAFAHIREKKRIAVRSRIPGAHPAAIFVNAPPAGLSR